MPRERIVHGNIYETITHAETESVGEWFEIKKWDGAKTTNPLRTDPSFDVSWDRDHGFVQLSMDIEKQQWLEISSDLNKDTEIVSRAIFTEGLSRQEINNLIRTLRRARDAAFGADE